jgi:hypothetical protein
VTFDDLAQLQEGWYDGEGLPPVRRGLEIVARALIEFCPDWVPLPEIVPTPEGNLLIEWGEAEGCPPFDIDLMILT